MSVSDIVVSAVIVFLVLIAAWRGGQANPVGTGRLVKRMDALELKVADHGERLSGVEQSLLILSDRVHSIDKNVEVIRIEVAAGNETADKSWAAIDRLQNYFIEDSFKRRLDK